MEASSFDGEDMSTAAVIDRYLSLLVSEPIPKGDLHLGAEALAQTWRAIEHEPAEVFDSLASYLKSQDEPRRVAASTLLAVLIHEQTIIPYGPAAGDAKQIVLDCLRSGRPDNQLRTLSILAQHRMPELFIGPVVELLTHRGSDLSICAALALRRYSPAELSAAGAGKAAGIQGTAPGGYAKAIHDALHLGLQQEAPLILRSNCAAAIFEQGEAESPEYAAATALVEHADLPYVLIALIGVYRSRSASPRLIEVLEGRLSPESQPHELSCAIWTALGSAARNVPRVVAKSLTRLRYASTDMATAFLVGVGAGPVTSAEVLEHLLPLLANSDVRLQRAAMCGLAAGTAPSQEVIDAVVTAIIASDDEVLNGAAASVLLAAGPSAIGQMRALIESGSPRLQAVVVMVVETMACDHLRPLLVMYAEQFDPLVDAIIRAVFGRLRAETAPLVPILCEALDLAPTSIQADTYVRCIAESRVVDGASVKAIARHLCSQDEGLKQLVAEVLLHMNEAAIGPLLDLREQSAPYAKDKITSIIERIASTVRVAVPSGSDRVQIDCDPAYLGICRELADDHLLRLFVEVVKVMDRAGGAASWGAVAKALGERAVEGDIPGELAPSKTALWTKMNRLSESVAITPLFENADKRRGGPTRAARGLFKAAIVHLSARP